MDDKKKDKKVHEDLEGFSIRINEFGEITKSFEVDKINRFLNEKVDDKKLKVQKEKLEEEE